MRKGIRTRLRRAAVIGCICASLAGHAYASDTLIPVGEAVGIRIALEGVLVADVGPAGETQGAASPAEQAGLRAGDVITAVNGVPVENAEELAKAVEELGGEAAELRVTRGGREMTFSVTPAASPDGGERLGLWLRDGVTGIGTVTYIDPETGAFGALGHGVNDAKTGALLPLEEGSVCRAQIVDVKRGSAGEPGELSGSFSAAEEIGVVEENTGCGIFGRMDRRWGELRPAIPVAAPSEMENGEATILACVEGDTPREYAVEIARAGLGSGDGREITVRVTDPGLLARTGGIVQGMSGSPILQNGRLIGAVTHVLTGDPTRGYGIFAESMLAAAEAA